MIPELRQALQSPNMRAFLRVIRAGETSQTDEAYRMMFGGELFTTFDAHPNRAITRGSLTSTAAGAYQFLYRTWRECQEALSLPDFSPQFQDLAAVFLIRRRGALADVLAGRIKTAIAKCAKEWASLPGSPYGQPTKTMAQALATYAQYGGLLDTSPGPVQKPAETEHVAKGSPMPLPAIIGALLPGLIEAIPKLGKLFGSGSEVAERNVKAAELAVSIAQEAIGATNAQEAVERAKSDPAAAQAITQAIEARWHELVESGGGGIDGARKANAAYSMPGGPRFWFNPAFWISLILIAMPMMLLVDVFYVHPESYVGELRTQIVTGVLMVIGMVGGYWIGTSMSSAKKDEARATP